MSTSRFDVSVGRPNNGGHYIWSTWLSDCGWETAYTTAAWLRSQGETCRIEPRRWWSGGLNPKTTER
jgi:hypothetical protein